MAFLLLEAAAGLTALFGIKKKERRKSIFTFAMASTKKKIALYKPRTFSL